MRCEVNVVNRSLIVKTYFLVDSVYSLPRCCGDVRVINKRQNVNCIIVRGILSFTGVVRVTLNFTPKEGMLSRSDASKR